MVRILIFLTACTWQQSVVQGDSFLDERCWQVQGESRGVDGCGVKIPPLAEIIEVNGMVLPVKNIAQIQKADFPYLILPKGKHSIRFNPGEKPNIVKIDKHFRTFYDDLRTFYGLPKSVNEDRLLDACGDSLDSYRQPFLLNIHGIHYDRQKRNNEAIRKWKRALKINPTFAPAHLNLAAAQFSLGNNREGQRELNLAEAFNIGDVYSIAEAIWKIRVLHGLHGSDPQSAVLEMAAYMPGGNMSQKDLRMVGMMQGLSKYAVSPADRAKILNNLAIYLAKSDKPEWACVFFRKSLSQLKSSDEYRRLRIEIMRHMRDVCKTYDMKSEAKEYAKVVMRIAK